MNRELLYRSPNPQGFTLLEVLVALTILALSLSAAIRASSAATYTTGELRTHLLASWVAENRAAYMRASDAWPDLGVTEDEIEMGGEQFLWKQVVTSTPNPYFRRIDIQVSRASSRQDDEDTYYFATLKLILLKK